LRVIKISPSELYRVLNIFKSFMMCYKGYWICNNEIFRRSVEKISFPKSEEKGDKKEKHEKEVKESPSKIDTKEALHKRIAEALEKSPICVRRLEEQTYHYYLANDTFMLKQIIANVENFLMLFNPMTKFDLFRYWQLLESCGYDPITEYNKGIELFDSHYNPHADKLFVIILQVCRFLKEFSDFETDITPVFRHPLIKDKVGVVKSISKKEENALTRNKSPEEGSSSGARIKLKEKPNQLNKSSTMAANASKKRRQEDPLGLNKPFYNEENEVGEVDIPQQREQNNEGRSYNTFSYLDVIGLLTELSNFRLSTEAGRNKEVVAGHYNGILESWEDVNIEVPEGRTRFREYFINLLKERDAHKLKIQERLDEKPSRDMTATNTSAEDDTQDDGQQNQKKSLHTQHEQEHNEFQTKLAEIDLEIKPEKPPSFYYYKRWLWIIFPWACLSIKPDLNYSEVIARCYSSATKYMKIDEEKEFYRCML
jgi:hypothetical protein